MINHKGDFEKSFKFLNRAVNQDYQRVLDKYGKMGVEALSQATPVDTGKTASSWYYETHKRLGKIVITWKNSNIVKGVPIAIILQYGHATRNGGYVQGLDYINPSLSSIFEDLAKEAWREVTYE